MRILRLVLVFATLAVLASPVHAGTLRIALLASTEVQSDTILLANLLPVGASRVVRDAAARIPLGASPQNGASRRFTRATLSAAIASSGLSPENFVIPDSVTIRRGGRPISLEEVYAAIQSSLAKNSLPGLASIQQDDIALDTDVRVPPGDAGLVVTQARLDPLLGRARFRLWARSAPGVLPFFATAELARSTATPSSSPLPLSLGSRSQIEQLDASLQVLVSADRPARLHLHSSNMDMVLLVRPLQKGRLGDVIRVRLVGTGRIMQARVAADGLLDATL